MAWVYLMIAGVAEISGVLFLKLSEGYKKPVPTVLAIVSGATSFYCLSLSLREIPIGTAYAIWTGIGSAGSVLAGMWLFKEPRNVKRIFFISCIIMGVAGLRFTGGH